MPLTEWYEPHLKPVRAGEYEAAVFDCGWLYEWRIFWDGAQWREKPNGEVLANQAQTWRGQVEQAA